MKNKKLSEKISIRVSPEEIKQLEKLANVTNCFYGGKPCVSKYIRRILFAQKNSWKKDGQQVEKNIVFMDTKPLILEIRKIGVNINQLAKLANMSKIETVYLNETQTELNEILKKLDQILKQQKGDGHGSH